MLTRLRPRTVPRGRLTFRAKLATTFASICFLVGAAVLVLVALLARHGTMAEASGLKIRMVEPAATTSPPTDTSQPASGRTSSAGAGAHTGANPELDLVHMEITKKLQDAALRQLILWPAVGLVLMAVLSWTTAWWLAGRALRPASCARGDPCRPQNERGEPP